MKNVLTTTLSVLPEGIGTTISIVMFIVLDSVHLLQTHITFIFVIACLLFLMGLFVVKPPFKKIIIWVSAFLLTLSVGSKIYFYIRQKSDSEADLIADATESIIEDYLNMIDYPEEETQWVVDAIKNHKIVFILIPTSVDIPSFLREVSDFDIAHSDVLSQESFTCKVKWNDVKQNGILIKSKYNLIWAYTPHLKEDWEYDCAKLLPESTYLTLYGIQQLQNKNWEAGRALLECADSLNNAAGSFYLSKWYGAGLNQEPNHGQELRYLEKAAKEGSRQARTAYGKQLLYDMESSSKRREGLELLLRSSVLNTVATRITVSKTEEALFAVNDYYHSLRKYRDAYTNSKISSQASNNPNIKYIVHLDNCIACKKFAEAHRIIEEGKIVNDPHCLVVHAGMFTLGNGERRDYLRAEALLRYAADSLDYYPAYKGLSELYIESGREGIMFWNDLFRVRFSNRIENNNYE